MIETLPSDVAELFQFEPHWAMGDGHHIHYVDEGPRDGNVVVLLHGNPTWAFLYRHIIPPIVAAGYRVIVPDHLGCGRSDHARAESEYAIAHHARRLLAVLDQAGVSRAVFFCQDWGGPIALGGALDHRELVAGLVLANTFWGEASAFHRRVVPWRAIHSPITGPLFFGRGQFVHGIRLSAPPDAHDGAIWHAYNLPFDAHGGPGATLAWPRAISLGPGHPTHALATAIWDMLPSLDVPTRFVWGGADQVFPPHEQGEAMRSRLPTGQAHPMVVIDGARHFVQEYGPVECAAAAIAVAQEAFAS